MSKLKFSITSVVITSLILTGCNQAAESKHDDHTQHDQPSFKSGDIQEQTDSSTVLPTFLNDQPKEIQNVYAAAGENGEILKHIPCYCGCGRSVGHKHNDNCFISERKSDGSIVWDDHGTKCKVCLEIAAIAVVEHQKGKSVKEIRTLIDEKYKEGFAEATPTPMP
ncbi:PCYCGC motif-containing (lipo)protein [Metabacillus herbersteinensis]|uniref:PCYCGC motif-containing (Lipo)protein n=1 Tax=Metabacillus herbersteinensis TaxID=283816 RepID=A0ABV6GL92_9BACI